MLELKGVSVLLAPRIVIEGESELNILRVELEVGRLKLDETAPVLSALDEAKLAWLKISERVKDAEVTGDSEETDPKILALSVARVDSELTGNVELGALVKALVVRRDNESDET